MRQAASGRPRTVGSGEVPKAIECPRPSLLSRRAQQSAPTGGSHRKHTPSRDRRKGHSRRKEDHRRKASAGRGWRGLERTARSKIPLPTAPLSDVLIREAVTRQVQSASTWSGIAGCQVEADRHKTWFLRWHAKNKTERRQRSPLSLSSEITQGRSDPGSSPCSRPPRSHRQTSSARPSFRRLQPGRGVGSLNRRRDRHACRST